MAYINKINPNKKMQKYIYNGVIITFLILIIYFIFFNNISLLTVTTFLFDSDLGRIVLLVSLMAIASNNLFLGVILLCGLAFLYEYQHVNISKYNNVGNIMVNSMSNNTDNNTGNFKTNNIYDIDSQTNNRNITIQDILNLENNISSKQSNNSVSFGNGNGNGFDMNSSNIMRINPSFEGTFNNNYAPFL